MRRSWACDLVHPAPVVAGLVLLLNDHVFKPAAWPSALVTGKLSDAAGMFLAPVLLTALARGLLVALGRRRPAASRLLPVLVALASGAVFAGLKLSPRFNGAFGAAWGPHALDPGDLLAALPALLLALWWMSRRAAGLAAPDERRVAVVAVLALACAATPAPRFARNYPSWELTGNSSATFGCAQVEAWVSKSGKTGFGVSVRAAPAGAGPCTVRIAGGSIVLSDRRVVPAALDRQAHALAGCQTQLYLPFAFDNDAAWNHGVRSGRLALEIEVDGLTHRWEMPAEHQLHGYQRERHQAEATSSPADSSLPDCAPGAPPVEPAPQDAAPLERAR